METGIESLGSIAGGVIAVGLLVAAGVGVGGRFVHAGSRRHREKLNAHLLRIPVGLNLIAALGVALGTANCLHGSGAIWLLGALSFGGCVVAWAGQATPHRQRGANRRRRFFWLAAGPLVLALITLGPAICYPTGWDELVYHQVLPRRWQADGWPTVYSDLPYSGFPSLAEMLFWLMAPLDAVVAPRLLIWVCWIL